MDEIMRIRVNDGTGRRMGADGVLGGPVVSWKGMRGRSWGTHGNRPHQRRVVASWKGMDE